MKRRLLIFPSGMCSYDGKKYVEFGNGHVVRCLNLARELVSEDPEIEITLGASGPEAAIARRLARNEFSVVEVPEVMGSSSHSQYSHRMRFETNLVRFLEPSLVICDTHSEGVVAAKYNSCKCVAILDLPPIEFFHVYAMLADWVLVPLTESSYQLPSSIQTKATFVGPILDARSIHQVNEKSMDELREEIDIQRPFILAYLSRIHSDRKQFVAFILEAYKLVQKRHPELMLVLIGPGAREEAGNETSIRTLEFVDNIHQYIKASSAFLTRSPIIAMEGLALGKKPIIVPIPSDLNQSTMALNLGEQLTYLPFEKLSSELLGELFEREISRGETEAGDALVPLSGTGSATRKILELVNGS